MPNLNFGDVLRDLGPDAAFRIINERRPDADYLLNTFLPERLMPTYDVKAGNMTIRPTMAGLVGADSPYPPGALIDVAKFMEQSAKIALTVVLPEMMQRRLREFLYRIDSPQQSSEAVRNTVLNFMEKMLVQPHLDTAEYLRGEVLTGGAIDWTFNGKRLQVSYGVPAANIFATRNTTAGYGGTLSVWWSDYRAALSILKGRVRAVIAHPDTINLIVSNPVNNIIITSQDLQTGTYSIARNVGGTNGPQIPSGDSRDRTLLIGYGGEGEIINPLDPDSTILVPFIPTGKVVLIGDAPTRGFQVGLGGAVESPTQALELGYTHVAPTEEGQGAMGRWARVFIPENRPYQVQGDSVTNLLPVLEAPEKLVILTTTMTPA